MAFSIITGLVGLGLAAYGAIHKAQAEKKAKQNLANRPVYNALPEDQSELNLAQQQASTGMGAGSRQQLQNNTDRNLATFASAIMMGGGNPNAIGSLAERTQNAYNNNAIYDDQVRQQHLGTLLNTYNAYNAQRQGNADKSFQFNKYAPWADRQQLYSQQIAGGQQTMFSGLNMAAKGFGGIQGGQRGRQETPIGSDTQGINASEWSQRYPGWEQPAVQGSFNNPGEYSQGAGTGNATSNFTNWGNGEQGMVPYYYGSGQ